GEIMKKINLVIACLTIVVSTFTAQSVCKASPIAVFNIGGSGMGVWCSCNGQKASIQYSGSAAPGAWIVEEGDCEGDGPCPWHYFGSVGYGGVWEVEAGKCFTGSLDFTLTTTST